ncbi:MAG: site-specific integrase, partial [Dehalococcoidia bacterium]
RLRNTLAVLSQRIGLTVEETKAWSQNLGHSDVLTTLMSYGEVPGARQAELIRGLGRPRRTKADALGLLDDLKEALREER